MAKFLIFTAIEAATVRGIDNPGHALEPRDIDAGPLAGNAILPLGVLTDPAYADIRGYLSNFPQAEIDPAICWPTE